MNSGLYAALSGNLAAMRRLDILSNNLANVNTPGFKKERMLFESLLASVKNSTSPPGTPTDAPVLAADRVITDYSPGPLKETGNPLDLAIEGDGFFVVNTPNGPAYTRQGNFRRDQAGRIVTVDGYELQGTGGPITITGGKVDVDARGQVSVDGAQVGTLQIVDFPHPYALDKAGNGLFVPSDPQNTPQATTAARISQGFIEQSNVNTIQEMVELIETNRFFEMCSKAVKSYDDLTARAANDLGKV